MDEDDLRYMEQIVTRLKDKEMLKTCNEVPCSCGNLLSENPDKFEVIKKEENLLGPKRSISLGYIRMFKCKLCGGHGGRIRTKKKKCPNCGHDFRGVEENEKFNIYDIPEKYRNIGFLLAEFPWGESIIPFDNPISQELFGQDEEETNDI